MAPEERMPFDPGASETIPSEAPEPTETRRWLRRLSRIFPVRRRLHHIARLRRQRRSVRLRLAWIRARILQGRLEQAERSLWRMADRYPDDHPVRRSLRALELEVLFYQGRHAEFLALFRRLQASGYPMRPRLRAMEWVVRATFEDRRALYREARTFLQAHPKALPALVWALAFIAPDASTHPEVTGLLWQALRKVRTTVDPRGVVETSLALAELHLRGRRLRRALFHARRALRTVESQDLLVFAPACHLLMARWAALRGRVGQARAHLRAVRSRRREGGNGSPSAEWAAVWGLVELFRGRPAHPWFDRALRESRTTQDAPWESEVLLAKAVAYAREGRWDAVERLLPQVTETSGRLLHPSFRDLLFRCLEVVHGQTPGGGPPGEGPYRDLFRSPSASFPQTDADPEASRATDPSRGTEARAEAELAGLLWKRCAQNGAGGFPGREAQESRQKGQAETGGRTNARSVSVRRRLKRPSGKSVPTDVPEIVGETPAIVEVRRQIVRLASLPVPVLICGETGTGKELVARALHRLGPHPTEPFIAINCAAIPEHLLESELFGYRQGAFTGADRDTPGLIERARHGTLFFDEIGDMSLHHQAKVLRVLQERTVRRLGDDVERPVHCRFVFATHRTLEERVRWGKFRKDLYFRIRAARIRLPALRERKADIPRLVEFFLQKYGSTLAAGIREVDRRTWDYLLEYPWPGNVRELESVLVAALIEARGDSVLRPEHLPPEVRWGDPTWGPGVEDAEAEPWTIRVPGLQRLAAARDAFERQYVRLVLRQTGYNKSQAARLLGICRTTLYQILNAESRESGSDVSGGGRFRPGPVSDGRPGFPGAGPGNPPPGARSDGGS